MKLTTIFAAAAVFAAMSFAAAGPAWATTPAPGAAKPAVKVIDVTTCPITGEKVMGAGAGFEMVGNYKVHFCCPGCQPEYDKLSKAQKLAKAKALAGKAK